MRPITILALLVRDGLQRRCHGATHRRAACRRLGRRAVLPGAAQPVVVGTDLVITKASGGTIEGEWRGRPFVTTLHNGRFSFDVPDWRLAFQVDTAGALVGTMVRQSTAGRFDLKYTKGSGGVPGPSTIDDQRRLPQM